MRRRTRQRSARFTVMQAFRNTRAKRAFGTGLLLFPLAAVAAQQPAQPDTNPPPAVAPAATNAIPLAVFAEAWDAYLATPVDKNPALREWKNRARLERDPLDQAAIEELIDHFSTRIEDSLSTAALQYAVYAGNTNNTRTFLRMLEQTDSVYLLNEAGKTEADPYIEVRLEWLREMRTAGMQQPILPSVYEDMEQEIRLLLRKSDLQEDLLIELARQYYHHREWPMAIMTAMLALRLNPTHPEMLDLCLNILVLPRYQPIRDLMIGFYAKRNDLHLVQIKRFITLCDTHNRKDAALAFRWQAAAAAPGNPAYLQEIGEILFADHKHKEATRTLKRAVQLPGHDVSIYHTLALIHQKTGDEHNMLHWLQRWRNKVDENQLVEALMRKPFNRYPKLLEELE